MLKRYAQVLGVPTRWILDHCSPDRDVCHYQYLPAHVSSGSTGKSDFLTSSDMQFCLYLLKCLLHVSLCSSIVFYWPDIFVYIRSSTLFQALLLVK